jgi:type II secretory pathway component GspD/PulD (secretin)
MRNLALAALIALLVGPALAEPPATRKKARSIANILTTQKISVDFKKATVDQFIKFVRTATGINIVVNKARIERDGGDIDAIEITLTVKNVKVLDVLKLALQGHELGLKLKGNILYITSKKDALGKPVLRIYSVAHLLVPIRDFPARDMNVYPSDYEPPEAEEPEVVQTYESSEELAELVRNFTGKDTWENEGISIHVFRKHLFIRTYPSVHREVARFLAMLPH